MDQRASKSGVGDSGFRKNLFGSPSTTTSGAKRYEKYENEVDDEENEAFLSNTMQQQKRAIQAQDETLDKIGSSVGVLKEMSQKIGTEVNEHLVIMDELGEHFERTDTTMSVVMKKLHKVSNMADDKTQWTIIVVLLVILFIVILLFFVL